MPFTPLEKAADFNRRSLPLKADGGLKPPSAQFSNGVYHVLARGNRKQEIFSDERDYQRFMDYLRDYREKEPFNLYAYILTFDN